MTIEKLDKWLLNNPSYSQEERELIIEAIIEYQNELNEDDQNCSQCGQELDDTNTVETVDSGLLCYGCDTKRLETNQ